MNLGRTSAVYFLSKLSASLFGFISTIVIARILGAGPLGTYNLVLGLVAWLGIVGKVGITGAISKRVSEGEEQEEYATAGLVLVVVMGTAIAIGLFLLQPYLNDYIGQPATVYVVLILFVTLTQSIVSSLLSGVHLVHLRGLLAPLRTGTRSILQIGTVLAGLGVVGLFFGYISGYLIVIAVGAVYIHRQLDGISIPAKKHFQSLFDYAKFAWVGSLQSRMFNYTDILVLGLFVSQSLIGVYAVAWNIAQFLMLFAGAIRSTLFPEMSELSAKNDTDTISHLVEEALSYSGLLLIPGLVGGSILGERILRIYGGEFTQGAFILVLLTGANLIMSYQNQILATLNAVDRPDLSFHVNVLFVVANVTLNLILIYLYGWVGAAVATMLSVSVSLILGFVYLRELLEFTVPWRALQHQALSAVLMGAVVYLGLWLENTYVLLAHNVLIVILLVSLGAAVYFLILLAISETFRTTVGRNLPENFL
jgi:O-antigen/teichoic acid export membrane protein